MPQIGGPAVPAGAVVQWADLGKPTNDGGLGWSVPPTRPNHLDNISPVTTADDFYSLQCNGWGNVNADRDECVKVKGNVPPYPVETGFRYGATHLRYDCTTKSLWVLTYVFQVGLLHISSAITTNRQCQLSAAGQRRTH